MIWVVLSRRDARREVSWRVKWAQRVVAMGFVRDRGRMWWNMVPASRWARTKHLRVCGELVRDMMDFVGQWLYVAEIVWTYVRAM
jgi:gamma-glutamyl:cysteine ligase YbdK (ATP-grasp superfamily)